MQDKDQIAMKVYEWLKGYAWTDDNGMVNLQVLAHDFLKDSRTLFD